jgi:Na+-transporting NADH:ubiquinone oxidoreductase subunit F
VTITINGDKKLTVPQGDSLMSTLNENGIFLPSACGGKGQLRTVQGAGAQKVAVRFSIHERPHFTRKADQRPLASGMPDKGEG